jgi:Predicted dehydrogenases and related proteins
MKNGKYRVTIAGAGRMGGVHAEAYKRIEEVEIAAVFDKDSKRAERFASTFNCKWSADLCDVLGADIDFVDICLPTLYHKNIALKCFESGKHVLCEKPISLTIKDAEEMVASAELHDKKLMIAQVVRFWPEYYKLSSMITGGELTGIKSVTLSRYGTPPEWSEGNWLLDDKKSGGVLYDLCIHDIDFAIWVFGLPQWVFAKKSMMNMSYTAYINIIFGYNDFNVVIESGFVMPRKYPFTAGFRLSTGEVALEYINKTQNGLLLYSHDIEGEKLQYENYDPYEKEIRYFIGCLKENLELSLCTPGEAIKVLNIIKCIENSANTNERVNIIV